jgi:flagellar operon protein
MSLQVPNAALVPPGVAPVAATPPAPAGQAPELRGPSFADVLGKQASSVQFSRHAAQRLERRGIDVGQGTMARLQDGVDRAAGKGSRESVVFVDGTAFVVSVPTRTVITAVDPAHMREHVFTNIDSAVIA